MRKLFVSLTAVVCLSFTSVASKKNEIPEPFRGGDNKSSYSIQYDDLSTLLRATVIRNGRSSRRMMGSSVTETGSRIATSRNSMTAMEANRVFYKIFEDPKNAEIVTRIRKDLEGLPTDAPLKYFSDREQIAYWMNLYNITMLEQMMKLPNKKLKKDLYGKKSILDKKLLNVAGVPLSLNDIQFNILIPKYGNNPLIMYGLYQGVIGSPNIRREAFTAKKLYEQLRSNAREFVNSNRGLYRKGKGKMQVSWLYKRNAALFPNFSQDLKKHMMKYVESDYQTYLFEAKKLTPKTMDYSRADINGGQRRRVSSSNLNSAAMMDAYEGTSYDSSGNVTVSATSSYHSTNLASLAQTQARFSPYTKKLLLQLKNQRKNGKVEVDQIEKEDEKDDGDK